MKLVARACGSSSGPLAPRDAAPARASRRRLNLVSMRAVGGHDRSSNFAPQRSHGRGPARTASMGPGAATTGVAGRDKRSAPVKPTSQDLGVPADTGSVARECQVGRDDHRDPSMRWTAAALRDSRHCSENCPRPRNHAAQALGGVGRTRQAGRAMRGLPASSCRTSAGRDSSGPPEKDAERPGARAMLTSGRRQRIGVTRPPRQSRPCHAEDVAVRHGDRRPGSAIYPGWGFERRRKQQHPFPLQRSARA